MLLTLLTLLASLTDEVTLHAAKSLTSPDNDDELSNLETEVAEDYTSLTPHTPTNQVPQPSVAVSAEHTEEEVKETANEADESSGAVALGELLVIRGEVAEEEEEVGVEEVIQSPEHISAVIHEHVGTHDLGLSGQVESPVLGEIVLLLGSRGRKETYKFKTRVVADLEDDHEAGETEGTALILRIYYTKLP